MEDMKLGIKVSKSGLTLFIIVVLAVAMLFGWIFFHQSSLRVFHPPSHRPLL